jgi:hypothetical protein
MQQNIRESIIAGKKIFIFSRDPGGANAIVPLVRPLENRGYRVLLYGADMSLNIYAKAGLLASDIRHKLSEATLEGIRELMNEISPDFILTGTSASDFTERYLWRIAGEMGIPCFAVLDHWINYGQRFSDYAISELVEYKKNRVHPYLPTNIIVMDDIAKAEMIKDGIEPELIITAGNPHFTKLIRFAETFSDKDIEEFKESLGIPASNFLITFASEPISTVYVEGGGSELYWGYSEYTILREILEALSIILPQYRGNVTLFVKLHPKEASSCHDETIRHFRQNKCTIIVDRECDHLKILRSSDLVIGMFSMLLIEAVIMRKPVISVQIGLKRENPFVLDRLGVLRSILTREALLAELREIILEKKIEPRAFEIIKDAEDRIISRMEEYLCRN